MNIINENIFFILIKLSLKKNIKSLNKILIFIKYNFQILVIKILKFYLRDFDKIKIISS